MGKEAIIDKLLSEATAKAELILAEAKKKAEAVAQETEALTTAAYHEAMDSLKSTEQEVLKRRASVSGLEARKLLLEAKQEAISDVFSEALSAIRALPSEAYLGYISQLIKNVATDGDIVIASKLDKKTVTAAFVKKVSDSIGKKLTLSKEYGDFSGGVILSNGGFDKNMTIEVELASFREDNEPKIASMLFSDKEKK